MSDDDPIRALTKSLLTAIGLWRAARAGDGDEYAARRVALECFDTLGAAVEAERHEVEPEPAFRTETVDNGRLWVTYRDGEEFGTSELGDIEWLPEDAIDVTFDIPMTPGQP